MRKRPRRRETTAKAVTGTVANGRHTQFALASLCMGNRMVLRVELLLVIISFRELYPSFKRDASSFWIWMEVSWVSGLGRYRAFFDLQCMNWLCERECETSDWGWLSYFLLWVNGNLRPELAFTTGWKFTFLKGRRSGFLESQLGNLERGVWLSYSLCARFFCDIMSIR